MSGEARRYSISRLAIESTLLAGLLGAGFLYACAMWANCLDQLHDPRFLTGWLLLTGLGGLALPRALLCMDYAGVRGRFRVQIAIWLMVCLLFALHVRGNAPNAPFEWALLALFAGYASTGAGLSAIALMRVSRDGRKSAEKHRAAHRLAVANVALLSALITLGGMHATLLHAHGFLARVMLGK